eukprot:COSAG05_NODE_2017_length_3688_cov_1.674283_4_plen_107_part_00
MTGRGAGVVSQSTSVSVSYVSVYRWYVYRYQSLAQSYAVIGVPEIDESLSPQHLWHHHVNVSVVSGKLKQVLCMYITPACTACLYSSIVPLTYCTYTQVLLTCSRA